LNRVYIKMIFLGW